MASVAGPPGNCVRSPKNSTWTPGVPPTLRSESRHTTCPALSARSTAAPAPAPTAMTSIPSRRRHPVPLVDQPHPRPLPAAEVREGEDRSLPGLKRNFKAGQPAPRHAGVDLGDAGAGQSERLGPVAGVRPERLVDPRLQGAAGQRG